MSANYKNGGKVSIVPVAHESTPSSSDGSAGLSSHPSTQTVDQRVYTISGRIQERKVSQHKKEEGENSCRDPKDQEGDEKMSTKWRNWIGFWLLGLCNNYGYVIMLSAAFDILRDQGEGSTSEEPSGSNNSTKICNPVSTGAVLLADVIPSLVTKMISPFFFTNTQLRVILVLVLQVAGFIVTAQSISMTMSLTGIVFTSIASGLGEVTFLSYSSKFDKRVVSGWSSGTGMAGLAGAGVYSLLTYVITPRVTILVMLVVPVIMAATFWILILHPRVNALDAVASRRLLESNETTINDFDLHTTESSLSTLLPPEDETTFMYKLRLVKPLLLRFMLPLGLVYFFEYFINQGFFELIFFPNTIDHKKQYRWYQTLYQLGVFASRSSVQFIQIEKIWILPVLQGVNFLLFLLQILTPFMSSMYVAMALIVYEGLLGGAAYVNTFYKISKESHPRHRPFNMGFTSLADSLGITLAGALSIPTHDYLCRIKFS